MSVVLSFKYYSMSVGSGDLLYSFFSTVAVRLEKEAWGSRFPVIMNELYAGKIPNKHLRHAEKELAQIKTELKKLPRTEVVWDFEDRSLRPPWGDYISDSVTDLSNYFVTNEGRPLLDVVGLAIHLARNMKESVLVESL